VSAAEQQEQAEDAQAQAEGSPADKRSTEDASGGEEATTVASAGAGPLNESGVTATHDDSDDSSGSRAQDSVAAGELGTTQPAGGGDEPQATEAAAPSAGGAVVSPGPGSDQEEQQEEEAPAAAAGSRKPSSSQLSGGATTAHDTAAGLSETEGEGGAPMQPHRDLSPGQQAGPHLVTAALEGQELEAVTAEWEEARQRVAAARAEQPARASSQQAGAGLRVPCACHAATGCWMQGLIWAGHVEVHAILISALGGILTVCPPSLPPSLPPSAPGQGRAQVTCQAPITGTSPATQHCAG
jgi:hypothetical protein